MIFLIQNCPARLFSSLQSMVEMVAENYHNIWAKKKKTELISKGVVENCARLLRPAAVLAAVTVNSVMNSIASRRRDPPTAGSL